MSGHFSIILQCFIVITNAIKGSTIGIYANYVRPHIVTGLCGIPPVERQRRRLIPRAKGRVLEIGMGAGLNFPFYDPDEVELVWGLEPAEHMRKLARKKVPNLSFELRFLDLPGEEVPLDDNSADTIVTTYTLCSIDEVEKALEQMRRVLKPGGEIIFCEHGEAPDEGARRWQTRLDSVNKTIFGCVLSRPIPKLLENAGFTVTEMKAEHLSGVPYVPPISLASFEYAGTAKIA